MVKSVILFSGGLDSTVVLALALSQGKECYPISFDYNQKHVIELEAAKKIAAFYQVPHKIVRIDPSAFGKSSLVSSMEVPLDRSIDEMQKNGIPSTYVPARNTLFLAMALGYCEVLGAQEIHFGPNVMDQSGYVDCRPSYINAFQNLMNVATKQAVEGAPPQLLAPLIKLNKTEIIEIGLSLKAPLDLTISCYNANNLGQSCNRCDACILRTDGFKRALQKEK